jgi:hypothetical protein
MSETEKLRFYKQTLAARLSNPGGLSASSVQAITERFSNSVTPQNCERLLFNFIESFGSEDGTELCKTVKEQLEEQLQNLNQNDVLNKRLAKRVNNHNKLVAMMAVEVDGKDYCAGDIGMIKSPIKPMVAFGTYKNKSIEAIFEIK